ncbi:hypothetical protein RJ639_022128 [Escallonia herrerae]|uniref:Uncharacterized protein n=1 Tax=Escallonia herrerae TaxID=1293975 RepID=A0AA89AFP5_9ASTE|nr:hypothetical protein RJ639_022128 [Escallonia herrerae]
MADVLANCVLKHECTLFDACGTIVLNIRLNVVQSWLNVMGVSLANATQQTLKNATDEKSAKMFCVCAPTSHAGSFRCRIHRAAMFQKSSGDNITSDGNVDGQPRVSRFGRVAAGGVQHDGKPAKQPQHSVDV